MNENLARKHEIVEQVQSHFQSANLAVIAEYRGVNVAGMSDLRRRAHESNVHIQVVKNTLARLAVKNTDFECLGEHFNGPVALAIAQDPVAAAKTVFDFAKENEQFTIQTGAIRGQILSPAEVEQMAKLPSREELLSQLAGTMAAPISKLLLTLNEIPTSFARTLAAIKESKQSAENENN